MIDASLDLTDIFVAFLTFINTVAVAAVLIADPANSPEIPHNIFDEVVCETIMQNNILHPAIVMEMEDQCQGGWDQEEALPH